MEWVLLFGLGCFFPEGKEGESTACALTAKRKAGSRSGGRMQYLQPAVRRPSESQQTAEEERLWQGFMAGHDTAKGSQLTAASLDRGMEDCYLG